MKYFCMPADFKTETLDAYAEINRTHDDARIAETYGNISVDNQFGSGRTTQHLPPIDLSQLKAYVAHSAKLNIDFNYTINTPYMNNMEFTKEGVAEYRRFLTELYDAGIRSLTLSLPGLIEIAAEMEPGFAIRASVLCNINNANKALEMKRRGVERIVVDESITRDFKTLKSIVDVFGDKVEIIINSFCQQDCSYRIFHYNQIAGDSICVANGMGSDFYTHRCALRTHKDPSTLMKAAWIRPEDLKYYSDIGIEYFKIQGRTTVVTGDPLRALQSYIDESYDGNLFELLFLFSPVNPLKIKLDNQKLDGFLKPFVEQDHFCTKNCAEHCYCDRFAKKALAGTGAEEVLAAGAQFLTQNDPYKRIQ
ncbi:U32 family peptidase [Pontiella sp.]|uniref:U32 family peptidase n=1 Tax=Pontiella sp. TaxID=2837462 RepID=UPI0035699EEE